MECRADDVFPGVLEESPETPEPSSALDYKDDFNALPALNLTVLEAAILIIAPV